MNLETMYKGIAFSPTAALTEDIGAGDTTIKVDSTDGFPEAPNYATIGADEQAETIYYGAKTPDTLSGCRRGIEGTAKEWQTGEIVGRNFTNVDYETLIANIDNLNKGKWETPSAKTENNFVSFDAQGKPKDSGKKAGDFDSKGSAEAVNKTLGQHTGNNEIHITGEERTKWNQAVTDKHTHANKTVLDDITQGKVTSWDEAATDRHEHSNKGVLDTITDTSIQNWNNQTTIAINKFTGLDSTGWELDPASGMYKFNLETIGKGVYVDLTASLDTLKQLKAPIIPVTEVGVDNNIGVLYTKIPPDFAFEMHIWLIKYDEENSGL